MEETDLISQYKNLNEDVKNKKIELFEKIKEEGKDIVSDHEGVKNCCFILSCPGEDELINGQLASGQTGRNICTFMNTVKEVLSYHEIKSDIEFHDKNQYDYSICNSDTHVYFRLVNKSEPDFDEINTDENIKRFIDFIKTINKKYIFVCGDNAEYIVKLAKNKESDLFENCVMIDKIPHLGFVGLRNLYKNNCIYKDKELSEYPQAERDKIRFKILAEEKVLIKFKDSSKND